MNHLADVLHTEPLRAIGYGGATVVLVLDALIGPVSPVFTLALMACVTIAVEGARRFVYSESAHVADLQTAWEAGHIEAHEEEQVSRYLALVELKRRAMKEPEQQTHLVPVAPAPPDGLPN